MNFENGQCFQAELRIASTEDVSVISVISSWVTNVVWRDSGECKRGFELAITYLRLEVECPFSAGILARLDSRPAESNWESLLGSIFQETFTFYMRRNDKRSPEIWASSFVLFQTDVKCCFLLKLKAGGMQSMRCFEKSKKGRHQRETLGLFSASDAIVPNGSTSFVLHSH